jgi:cell division protease FtsH
LCLEELFEHDQVKAIVDSCYARARGLLTENKDKLTLLATTLREKEVMDGEEVKKLLGFA